MNKRQRKKLAQKVKGHYETGKTKKARSSQALKTRAQVQALNQPPSGTGEPGLTSLVRRLRRKRGQLERVVDKAITEYVDREAKRQMEIDERVRENSHQMTLDSFSKMSGGVLTGEEAKERLMAIGYRIGHYPAENLAIVDFRTAEELWHTTERAWFDAINRKNSKNVAPKHLIAAYYDSSSGRVTWEDRLSRYYLANQFDGYAMLRFPDLIQREIDDLIDEIIDEYMSVKLERY